MNSHDDDRPRRGPPDNPWGSARPRTGQARPDKRERERLKAAGQGRPPRDAAYAERAPPSYAPRSSGPRADAGPRRSDERPTGETTPRPELQQRHEELRLFGINACKAAFAARPQDLRKAYLTEQRIAEFKQLLAWCVKHRLGYRVVEEADLARLSASQHHEGICLEMRRQAPLALAELLARQPPAPQPSLLVVLDGVGNPHNFGAVLRSAANFAVGGIVLPADSSLSLSGAACRVAEGGAEAVALARPQPGEDLLALLRAAGYTVAATVPRDGLPLYRQSLPARLALIFGAENEGMSAALIQAADLRLQIPGSGKVESLNIAASAAVLFAEHYRQHLVS